MKYDKLCKLAEQYCQAAENYYQPIDMGTAMQKQDITPAVAAQFKTLATTLDGLVQAQGKELSNYFTQPSDQVVNPAKQSLKFLAKDMNMNANGTSVMAFGLAYSIDAWNKFKAANKANVRSWFIATVDGQFESLFKALGNKKQVDTILSWKS